MNLIEPNNTLLFLVAENNPFGQSAIAVLIAVAVLLAVHFVATARRDAESTTRWSLLDRALYCVFLVAIGGLSGTSLGSIWMAGHLGGWSLLLHMAFAGAFVFVMALVALWWAPVSDLGAGARHRFPFLSRLVFWAMLAAGILTSGTMFVSMLPVLDTEGLTQMIGWHRYAGLATVVFAVVHAYGISVNRIRQTPA